MRYGKCWNHLQNVEWELYIWKWVFVITVFMSRGQERVSFPIDQVHVAQPPAIHEYLAYTFSRFSLSLLPTMIPAGFVTMPVYSSR